MTYFKDIGTWFLPYAGDNVDVYINSTDMMLKRKGSSADDISVCNDATKMNEWLKSSAAYSGEMRAEKGSKILKKCCKPSKYWASRRHAGIQVEPTRTSSLLSAAG